MFTTDEIVGLAEWIIVPFLYHVSSFKEICIQPKWETFSQENKAFVQITEYDAMNGQCLFTGKLKIFFHPIFNFCYDFRQEIGDM